MRIIKGSHEPVWRYQHQLFNTPVPHTMKCWLLDAQSLTARLIAACDGRFQVQVLKQHWSRPQRNEAERLGIPHHETAFIREVYLYCDDTPWVFARTIIPRRTLRGRLKGLTRLGSRPLGAVLFTDPGMRRDPVEVAQIQNEHSFYDRATQRTSPRPESIWGRRSVFFLDNKPLLVNEIFLPAIKQCSPPNMQHR